MLIAGCALIRIKCSLFPFSPFLNTVLDVVCLCGMGLCPVYQLAHWKQGAGTEKTTKQLKQQHPWNGTGVLAVGSCGHHTQLATTSASEFLCSFTQTICTVLCIITINHLTALQNNLYGTQRALGHHAWQVEYIVQR